MATRLHATVRGRVQGVGFRFFAQRTAKQLGLAGYVRNRPNGDVELEVEGAEADVSAFVEAMRRGPPGAHVVSVDTGVCPRHGSESDFEIRF
jgi:acylphosphatase